MYWNIFSCAETSKKCITIVAWIEFMTSVSNATATILLKSLPPQFHSCQFYSFRINRSINSSGIRQKGESQKRVFQESKTRQNFRKTNISYPLIRTRTCAYQEVRNACFPEILACFTFLKHPFLRFALLRYSRPQY